MRTYIRNSKGEFVGVEVGNFPIIFKTEDEAIAWSMETACTLAKERWLKNGTLSSGRIK